MVITCNRNVNRIEFVLKIWQEVEKSWDIEERLYFYIILELLTFLKGVYPYGKWNCKVV